MSDLPGWIVGFTDGEGTFSCTVTPSHQNGAGYRVYVEYVVSQSWRSQASLRIIKSYFGCGDIYLNRRTDNHLDSMNRYCVRKHKDLLEKIIPFFNTHELRTIKKDSFLIFRRIVLMMAHKKHLDPDNKKIFEMLAHTCNPFSKKGKEIVKNAMC